MSKRYTRDMVLEQLNTGNKDFSCCDLSGLDLHGLDLSYCNLIGADLSHANLSNAKLFKTNLSRSILYQTRILETQKDDLLQALQMRIGDE